MFATWMCLLGDRCILWFSISMCEVSISFGIVLFVYVMLSLMYVSSPPPCPFVLSFRVGVYPGIFGVFDLFVSFVSCMVIMSMSCFVAVFIISVIFLFMPFMLICNIFSVLLLV